MSGSTWDVVVVGAGIVGLASARALAERSPGLRLAVLDKEREVAVHQTGHNSGVIHSGVYYRPGSLKARLCVAGARQMIDYCRSHNIPHELCGKVIVATDESEIGRLDELERRGHANGVPGLRRLSAAELRDLEPQAAGIAALHSPHTGIVDYRTVARCMAADLITRGVPIMMSHSVRGIQRGREELVVTTSTGRLTAHFLVNCAGLHSDEVARMAGARPRVRIVPFRGEYYFLRPEARTLIRGLIYPVPDPDLPFLGVHFTRTVEGEVEAGPNAVLALAREGYARTVVDVGDMRETLTYFGFWRLASRYWRTGIDEFRRSFSRAAFAASLQRLVPAVQETDLVPGGAGVRAQAVAADGMLVDDFVIEHSPRAVHVLNAPSPAATASIAIGDHVASVAAETFGLPA